LSRAISSSRAGKFFERFDVFSALSVVTRAGRELAEPHGAQLPAQGLFAQRDAKLLEDPLHEIDQPPAHDAMNGRYRPALDDAPQGVTMRLFELRCPSRDLAVDEPLRALGVELHHPVAHDLARHAAGLGSLGARAPVIDDGKGEQSARLGAVLGSARKPAQSGRVKIAAKRNGHGKPPGSPHRFRNTPIRESPSRVTASETWY
jgi:hypothetical protein